MQTKIHIKICGITNFEDARFATEAGADLLGFNFYAKSARVIAPDQAAKIVAKLRARNQLPKLPKMVGIFVNEESATVNQIAAQVPLDYVQFHGDEPTERLTALAGKAYKALRPASPTEAEKQAALFAALGPEEGPRWLIDAYDKHAYGGTGLRTDWTLAAHLARQYPGLLLAGGLTPDNVFEAIRQVQPWGVDVASGVEAEPGRKDHVAIQKFIAAARASSF